jgi:hypothetical protein
LRAASKSTSEGKQDRCLCTRNQARSWYVSTSIGGAVYGSEVFAICISSYNNCCWYAREILLLDIFSWGRARTLWKSNENPMKTSQKCWFHWIFIGL